MHSDQGCTVEIHINETKSHSQHDHPPQGVCNRPESGSKQPPKRMIVIRQLQIKETFKIKPPKGVIAQSGPRTSSK